MSGRISMQDVANAAGVSVSTVSLALAGDDRVASGTAKRILEAASGLGYVRDPVIAALASSRFRHTRKPALIAVAVRREAALPALRRTAESYGYALRDLAGVPPGRFTAACSEFGVCAVILGARSRDLPRAVPAGLPTVHWLHEGDIPDGQHTIEMADWSLAVPRTVARIRQAGHRRIGIVLMPADPPHWADEVRRGAALATGLPLLAWSSRRTAELAGWIRECGLDALAVQHPLVWRRLRESGLQLPCAAMSLFATADPRLAGFLPDLALRDRMTIEMIDAIRRHGPRPTLRTILPSFWRGGSSLRRPS